MQHPCYKTKEKMAFRIHRRLYAHPGPLSKCVIFSYAMESVSHMLQIGEFLEGPFQQNRGGAQERQA